MLFVTIEELHHRWVPVVIIYICAYDQMRARAIPSEAIHSRKIKFFSKLQLSDNILFKTFTKSNPTGQFVTLSSIYAAIYWNVIMEMDTGCYFYFF